MPYSHRLPGPVSPAEMAADHARAVRELQRDQRERRHTVVVRDGGRCCHHDEPLPTRSGAMRDA